MNVTVSEDVLSHFWEEPPPGHREFWKFRFPPPCKINDVLWFRLHNRVIASAIVLEIVHRPKSYTDDRGATFGPGWYVYWHPQTFVDRRNCE